MSDIYIGNRMSGASGSRKIDISSATITLVSNNFVYDGTNKTQDVSSVVVNGQTLTAGTDYTIINNTQVDAGTYTLQIHGTGNYEGIKNADWSIAKATGSVSANPTSLSIQGVGSTGTSTLTVVGDGNVTVGISASSVATASVSGNTVTVTSAGSGSATITVTLAASTNYTGDSATISVSVVVISSTLSDCTPAEIQMAAQQDIGASLWSVGDRTAAISVGAVGNMSATDTVCAFILGFDHNESIEGKGIHFQFGKTTGGVDVTFIDSGYNSSKTSDTWFNMNNSATNAGGWNGSRMKTTICPAFFNALPSAWQNVISICIKYTDNTGGGSNTASYVTATDDKIWLLAEYEVFGTRNRANSAEQNYQQQYTYYASGNSKVKYNHTDISTACYWFMRSVYASRSDQFCLVGVNGAYNSAYANYSMGVSPGFRIA